MSFLPWPRGNPSCARLLPGALLALPLLGACAASPDAGQLGALRPLRPDTLHWNGEERDADLLHVELDLALDFEGRRVTGSATSRVRALVDGTAQVRLHADGLEIEAVRDGEGRVLAHRLDEPLLHVELGRPLARGEEVELRVDYRAQPERGLYFVTTVAPDGQPAPQIWSQGQEEDNRAWFPCWDYPNDRFTYRGRFRVGGGMSVVSNGVLRGIEEHEGGERSYTWELERTLTTYLVAVAAGRWERYADDWRGVPVEYYVAPGVGEERARRAFGETPRMLEFFSERLGTPYPYGKYAQVAVAEFVNLGMENTTVTFQTDDIVVDADAALDLDGDPRLLVAHELAHQWFGDLVTCLRWSDLWLNEAWASYCELLFERELAGDGSFQAWLERYRERYLAAGALTALPVAEDWRTQLTLERAHHVYDKGPWLLHMLHAELGDGPFWQATRDYLARHAEGLVTTADFWRAVFDSTGRNIEGFLEQWVEGAGHPQYRVSFEGEGAAGDTLTLVVRQIQPTTELVPLFDVTLAVDLYGAGGGVARHSLRVDGAEQRFELPLASELRDLVFDADCAVLCTLELEKPATMWAHQSGASHAGLRWRALPELVRERSSREERALTRAAHLAVLRDDPEELLRAQAALLWRPRREPRVLLDALFDDPAARVRLVAAEGLTSRELSAQDRTALEARRALEPSPGVRAAIDALLAQSKARRAAR